MSPTVAIHQPNFFPWLGFFNKIVRSDVFIVLDDAQYPQSGAGNWVNRVKIMVQGTPHWLTAPVGHHQKQLINKVTFSEPAKWRQSLIKTLKHNYGKHAFFNEIFPLMEKIINDDTNFLANFNLNAISYILNELRINQTQIILSSSLEVKDTGTKRLIKLVKAVDGNAYLCGGGTSGYQDDRLFEEKGIEVIYQNFKHPTYTQKGSAKFTDGLSMIDTLMNCGLEKTREMIM
jgi:hypothetical protein